MTRKTSIANPTVVHGVHSTASRLLGVGLATLGLATVAVAKDAPTPRPPNIILILADDLGYSDIGPYGGEVATPNLDRLAAKGIRFRQFTNSARCCPTRASLLTGLHPHEAGIGLMTSEEPSQPFDFGTPAYQGFLRKDVPTLADALKKAGYRTLMAGKWHVGTFEGMWPLDRGFDRFYGIIRGASNFYEPEPDKLLTLDRTPVSYPLPEDYYTTTAFTDHAMEFIRESVEKDPDQPFFLYLAYTAPHWPLQVPESYVRPYRDLYRRGWDALAPERLKRVVQAGVLPPGAPNAPQVAPSWDSLPEAKREEMAHRMALYAGMITAMDEQIGRLLDELETLGRLENTMVIFLSDNGGCAEGGMLGGGDPAELGTRKGYWLTLGEAWAHYSNTPFARYKHYTNQGGINTPCIISWPAGLPSDGRWTNQVGSLLDFMPTFLDAAGTSLPNPENGSPQYEGISLLDPLRTEQPVARRLFFEHEGNKAVIEGTEKLVMVHGQGWRLYDLKADPAEQIDLAGAQPERVKSLTEDWNRWAARVGVLAWPAERLPGYTPPSRPYPNTAISQ